MECSKLSSRSSSSITMGRPVAPLPAARPWFRRPQPKPHSAAIERVLRPPPAASSTCCLLARLLKFYASAPMPGYPTRTLSLVARLEPPHGRQRSCTRSARTRSPGATGAGWAGGPGLCPGEDCACSFSSMIASTRFWQFPKITTLSNPWPEVPDRSSTRLNWQSSFQSSNISKRSTKTG